jgi:hypothetical protein
MAFLKACCVSIFAGFMSVALVKEAAAGEHYKSFDAAWCVTYALKEFDKNAPQPGVNWDGEDITQWVAKAADKGWVTKKNANDAKAGAIVILQHQDKKVPYVGVVREVKNDGLIFELKKSNGELKIRNMTFDKLASVEYMKGYVFYGYIWPERSN